MKNSELAMRAYESGRAQAAITFGNEWIIIRVKFPNSQTIEVRYPAELAPYKTGYPHHCITEHIAEAANYWYVMANSVPPYMQDTFAHERRKIMCSRSHILRKKCEAKGYIKGIE